MNNIKIGIYVCQNPDCGKEFKEYKCNKRNKKYCSNHCRSVCYRHSKEVKKKMSIDRRGKNAPYYGKRHSEETKRKIGMAGKGRIVSEKIRKRISASHQGKKGIPQTDEQKRQARIRMIEYRKRSKGFMPFVGKNEKKILDGYEKENNCILKRSYYIKELGYIVDGYDKKNNKVIEVYEKYHENIRMMKRDNIRQKEIENFLKCNFIIIWDISYQKVA